MAASAPPDREAFCKRDEPSSYSRSLAEIIWANDSTKGSQYRRFHSSLCTATSFQWSLTEPRLSSFSARGVNLGGGSPFAAFAIGSGSTTSLTNSRLDVAGLETLQLVDGAEQAVRSILGRSRGCVPVTGTHSVHARCTPLHHSAPRDARIVRHACSSAGLAPTVSAQPSHAQVDHELHACDDAGDGRQDGTAHGHPAVDDRRFKQLLRS